MISDITAALQTLLVVLAFAIKVIELLRDFLSRNAITSSSDHINEL